MAALTAALTEPTAPQASAPATPAPTRFVAYFRVSTDGQGLTGLGMDAQRSAVADYLRRLGPERATLLAEYVEVESGKRSDRPELGKAMAHSKGAGATLLIAKLDRLSRDAHFLLGLQKGGIDFVACDMPDANRLTVTILAAVAEHELRAISERTKAALVEARKRVAVTGQRKHPEIKRLGNPNGIRATLSLGNAPSIKGIAAIKAGADARAMAMQHIIAGIRAVDGITSAKGIAGKLNALGYRTPRTGSKWCAKAVIRLTARLDALSH